MKKIGVSLVAALMTGMFSAALLTIKVSAAACAPTTDYGTATTTVNISATGSYRAWSRMMADSTTAANNSYFLEIDGNTCYVVGDNTALSGTAWTWIDYQNATTTSKINHTFSTTGSHTVKLIGREPNVKLDRVIFTQDTACVPTGTGDNCASPPDTTPPTVSMTAPAAGATVSGTVAVTADAADADSGIQKVGFYYGTTLIGEDTSSPYSVNWNTTSLTNGSYSLTAKATNGAGGETTSAARSVTVSNASPADLIVTGVTMSPANPTTGQAVTFSATVQNTGGTATPAGTIVGVLFKVDGAGVSWSDNSTTSLGPGQTRTLTANTGPSGSATWTATAGTHTVQAQVDDVNRITESNESNNTSSISVTVTTTPPADTTPPTVSLTAPANGATVGGTVNVTASSSDNIGVSRVEFYIDGNMIGGPDGTSPYAASLNTTVIANGTHTLTAKAFDQAGNQATTTGRSINVSNRSEDINQDGSVNLLDFSLLASKFGQTGASLGRSDINQDGICNLLDFSLLASKFGT